MVVVERPRVRVTAGSSRAALEASTSLSGVAFRGLGAAAAAADDEDGDEDAAATTAAADDDADEAKKAGAKKKAKKAKTSRPDPDEDGDDDGGDDDEDEDEDREDMKGRGSRAIRLRERARVAAILEHPAAKANLDLALRLALNTFMPRSEARALLDSLPRAAAGTGLADRMAQYGGQRPGAGAPPAPTGQKAIDLSWDAAASRAGLA